MLALVGVALGAGPVAAQGRKVKVGLLKLTSSAPIFLGVVITAAAWRTWALGRCSASF